MKRLNINQHFILILAVMALSACADDDEKTLETKTSEAKKAAESAQPSQGEGQASAQIVFTQDDLDAAEKLPVSAFTVADLDTDGPRTLNWELYQAEDYFSVEIPSEAQAGEVISQSDDHYESSVTVVENSPTKVVLKGRLVEKVDGASVLEREYDYEWSQENGYRIVVRAKGQVTDPEKATAAVDVVVNLKWNEDQDWSSPSENSDLSEKIQVLAKLSAEKNETELSKLALEILNDPKFDSALSFIEGSGSVVSNGTTYDFKKIGKISALGFLIGMASLNDPS